jgi:Uncharacterized protein conserved in bacteria (DUF2330)
MSRLLKRLPALAIASLIALGLFAMQALPAFACGGLVAPNGSVRLSRATTFVAWHNGIEHYMTSFSYEGNVSNLGWIVPLPAVPLKIEEGGAWTLQRLFRETHPVPHSIFFAARAPAASDAAQVLQQVKVEALNITVLRGSGQAVLNWASSNGFFLDDDTHDHLLTYAKGSPIFMAAKYDTSTANQRHLLRGDGTPLLITMQVPHIWVPLEVLALDGQQVQADLYLLTDKPVNISDVGAKIGQSPVGSEIPGAPGFTVSSQEQMTPTLFHDLSTDRNMNWIPNSGWLTYLSLDAPDTAVTYDLGVSASGIIRLAPFGTPPMAVVDGQRSHEVPSWIPGLPLGTPQTLLWLLPLLVVMSLLFWRVRARLH